MPVAFLAVLPRPAPAAEIELRAPQLALRDEGYAVSADFTFELGPRLEEAVMRGVVLTFVYEFELLRPRWYWRDEKVASRSRELRLSYHALTRQYRLSAGSLHQSFPSLDDALGPLLRLRNWTVAERGDIRAGETYQAALRLRLDTAQLPKPFQLSAIVNRDWELASDWARWGFSAGGEQEGKRGDK